MGDLGLADRDLELFFQAVEEGSVEDFNKYFKNKFLETKFKDKNVIHIACQKGHFEIVKLLINKNCNIEALDEKGWRPLHHACRENWLDIIEELLRKNCEIDPRNIDNWTPLHYAAGYGHAEVVKKLINSNSDFEAFTFDNWRPIHNACRFGHLEVIKVLLDNNCNIEARDKDQCTPTHYACMKGHTDILDLLIERNCDLEVCDGGNWRPIHHACNNGHIAIVEKLFQNGCDVKAKTSDNDTPLSLAINKNEEFKKFVEEEIAHFDIVAEMAQAMDLQCDTYCKHNLCPRSLRLKNIDKRKLLGQGAFGKVYQCISTKDYKKYAVKLILKSDLDNPEEREQFINKMKNDLNHSRVIKIYGSFGRNNKLCIFMEFMEGGTLQNKINKETKLSRESVIRFSKQILEGVEYLHRMDIIHRDIKPANILLDKNENVKLADFDFSRSKETRSFSTFCGTANFMAPELINDIHYTFSADIWSVGATIVNMITGKAPYEELTIPEAVMYKISTIGFKFPEDENISVDIKKIIIEMMNQDKDKRPTATQLLQNEMFHLSS